MTDKITIEWAIKELKQDCENNCPVKRYRAGSECLDCYLGMAIEALEYRKLKQPVYDHCQSWICLRTIYVCPTCGLAYDRWTKPKFCPNCGQAISWEEEDD